MFRIFSLVVCVCVCVWVCGCGSVLVVLLLFLHIWMRKKKWLFWCTSQSSCLITDLLSDLNLEKCLLCVCQAWFSVLRLFVWHGSPRPRGSWGDAEAGPFPSPSTPCTRLCSLRVRDVRTEGQCPGSGSCVSPFRGLLLSREGILHLMSSFVSRSRYEEINTEWWRLRWLKNFRKLQRARFLSSFPVEVLCFWGRWRQLQVGGNPTVMPQWPSVSGSEAEVDVQRR